MEIENNRFVVRYKDNSYDLSKFLLKHPGGVNTLIELQNSDVTSKFTKAPPHSIAAIYLMKEYKLEHTPSSKENQKTKNISNGHAVTKEIYLKDFEQHHPIQNEDEKINNYENAQRITDDSMEHLVDWSRAMIPQINTIAKYYTEWVNKPVDRPLRLFEPWYLEMFTRSPWWVVPSFWMPVVALLVYMDPFMNQSQLIEIVLYFISGIFIWTLVEYALHRWLFHIKLSGRNPWLCTLHFLLHGLQHKVPFDHERLVFPVLPAIIIASMIYTISSCLLAPPKIIYAGGLCGYVCYDLMHYYLHNGDPTLTPIYQLKRYHYQHHFVHHDRGFGVSSPIWDLIFSTRIFLRKMGFLIRWKF